MDGGGGLGGVLTTLRSHRDTDSCRFVLVRRLGWAGLGELTLADGTKYVGGFSEHRYSGHGVLQAADGSSYDGQWEDGMKTGSGRFTYADGAVYNGTWHGGLRHGSGTFTAADGALTYSGPWGEDRPLGTTRLFGSLADRLGALRIRVALHGRRLEMCSS